MCLAEQLLQHDLGVIGGRVIAFKKLACGHHDLVRGFAAPTAAPHAISQDGQQTSFDAGMAEHSHLILLVVAVSFVNPG
ncbi:MAG: hypothetical protein ACD_23C00182G0002 [uncultured bacterium]|nr:MAG: hypothetical protein ACD_23C00182G0002 [uncultured bacterium]